MLSPTAFTIKSLFYRTATVSQAKIFGWCGYKMVVG
ncbi:unnamed protein product [Debaryomyces tyrocola]|nr:unnamed protein product [Debaryomyces tyrocola]